MEVDPELVVADPDLTLAEGAIAVWGGGHVSDYFVRLIEALGDVAGVQRGHAVAAAAGRGAQGAAARPRRAGARPVQEPVRPGALVLHQLRGRDPLHRAAARRGGERLQPGAVRRVHARGALPDLPGRPAQAGLAGGQGGRQVDLRLLRASRSASWPSCCSPWSCPTGTCRSRAACSRRSTRGWGSCSTSAWTTCRWTGRRPPWPAARRSGSGWPPRSARAWSACCTCWTSPRSGCTSGTTTGCSRPCCGCATWATR